LNWSIDLSIFGGNLANVQWNVFAADASGLSNKQEVLVTSALGQASLPTITNGNLASVAGIAYENIVNQCGVASTVCATADPLSNTYFGGSTWGGNMQYLTTAVSGTLGTAMGFYAMDRSTSNAGGTPVTTAYANSAGFAAEWLLNADGSLSYTSAAVGGAPVPVPAAIWLLLSGLSGLGVIGRRRSAV
jgi:hypothetical protein